MNDDAGGKSALSAELGQLCSHCRFSLPASDSGLRHYGTHTAHQENECLRLLHAEIERLRGESLRFDREPPADCPHGSQCLARGACWRKCSLVA
jgi:hypothetical protein